MKLAGFPRIQLAHLPTPLERLDRLTKELGGPEIWIKRDDCTGLSTGGNKARKLEFLMAEAQAIQADTVLTCGAVQSNHVRQTAAFASKLGMDCHILLQDRTGLHDALYDTNGNVLLNHLHGATILHRPAIIDLQIELAVVSKRLQEEGRKVFVIPVGGSNPTGSLGYVDCALELAQQARERKLPINHLITATGSCGTQAGLVVGFKAEKVGVRVTGISVKQDRIALEQNVFDLAVQTARLVGSGTLPSRDDVIADSSYVGPGYGLPGKDTLEAIRMFAQLEGILLDPVYSGKGAAGMIDYCRKRRFKPGEKLVFLHTGGAASLFGYEKIMANRAEELS